MKICGKRVYVWIVIVNGGSCVGLIVLISWKSRRSIEKSLKIWENSGFEG